MTHEEIDAMPAGPELDALACAAVGWEPAIPPFQVSQVAAPFKVNLYRPISTDTATAMEALSGTFQGSVTYSRNVGLKGIWWAEVWTPESNFRCPHDFGRGDTAPLAIARALAKSGVRR